MSIDFVVFFDDIQITFWNLLGVLIEICDQALLPRVAVLDRIVLKGIGEKERTPEVSKNVYKTAVMYLKLTGRPPRHLTS